MSKHLAAVLIGLAIGLAGTLIYVPCNGIQNHIPGHGVPGVPQDPWWDHDSRPRRLPVGLRLWRWNWDRQWAPRPSMAPHVDWDYSILLIEWRLVIAEQALLLLLGGGLLTWVVRRERRRAGA